MSEGAPVRAGYTNIVDRPVTEGITVDERVGRRSGGWSLGGWHRSEKENRLARKVGRLGRSKRMRMGRASMDTSERTDRSHRIFVFPWFSPFSFFCSFHREMTFFIPFTLGLPNWYAVCRGLRYRIRTHLLCWADFSVRTGRLALHSLTPPTVAASLAFCTSSGVASHLGQAWDSSWPITLTANGLGARFSPLGQGSLSVGQAGGRGGLRTPKEIHHHLRSPFYLDCRDGSDRVDRPSPSWVGCRPALGALRFDLIGAEGFLEPWWSVWRNNGQTVGDIPEGAVNKRAFASSCSSCSWP